MSRAPSVLTDELVRCVERASLRSSLSSRRYGSERATPWMLQRREWIRERATAAIAVTVLTATVTVGRRQWS